MQITERIETELKRQLAEYGLDIPEKFDEPVKGESSSGEYTEITHSGITVRMYHRNKYTVYNPKM